ncbi:MAG: hypothetical protein HY657_14580 [Acidobacteria bacterium]|nr:hypothetical protein [Acidobacteriota bacterium]
MRRLSGFVLAGAMMMLPAFSQGHGTAFAQQAPQPTTFTGDMVLWAFSVRADKTGDYEKVLTTLKDSLMKSEKPEARQQLAGWKVMRNPTPQPDGTILYIHVINPVVPKADYSITNIVYDVIKDPAQQTAFFEMYRGAISAALFMIQGPVSADFSR